MIRPRLRCCHCTFIVCIVGKLFVGIHAYTFTTTTTTLTSFRYSVRAWTTTSTISNNPVPPRSSQNLFRSIAATNDRIHDVGSSRRRYATLRQDEDDNNHVIEENTAQETGKLALFNILRPSSSCNVDRMSGTDLAYIGDVVYELYVRSRTVWVSENQIPNDTGQ